MKIKILASAVADLGAGRDFYDRQEIGIGDYFQDSLFSDIDSLVLYAGIHRQVLGYYRMLSKRFPFAIYYRLEDSMILVFRVLDCRSNPQRLSRALGNE